jgi:hypothetical protein
MSTAAVTGHSGGFRVSMDKDTVHREMIKERSCALEQGLLYISEIAKILF